MSEPLLHAAFEKDDQKARMEWSRWRETADLNALRPSDLAVLPLLNRRFLPWIEDDPAKPMLLGICKQAWSRNQIRLRKLSEVADLLTHAGLAPIVTGTAATVLLSTRCEMAEGEFLAIPRLEFLLRREAVAKAMASLKQSGWHADGQNAVVRNTASSVSLRDDRDIWCLLRWRLLSDAPDVASEAIVTPSVRAEWKGHVFTVPSPSWQLAHQLFHPDHPAWMTEALLVLQHEIDGDEFRRALAWASSPGPVAERIRELRDQMGAQLPFATPATPGKFASIWRDYQRWRTEENHPGRGPLPYLRARWDAGSNLQLPQLALKMLAEFLRT